MKKYFLLSFGAILFFSTFAIAQQDKSKRPSPPDSISVTTSKGLTITINYSKPSLKGRSVGNEVAPYGKVWRTGANEATTFEVNKDVTINGQSLPKGKYSLYTIPTATEWTIIFNKVWNQWGTVYNQPEDALRVTATPTTTTNAQEQLKYTIDKTGKVSILWGNTSVSFNVK